MLSCKPLVARNCSGGYISRVQSNNSPDAGHRCHIGDCLNLEIERVPFAGPEAVLIVRWTVSPAASTQFHWPMTNWRHARRVRSSTCLTTCVRFVFTVRPIHPKVRKTPAAHARDGPGFCACNGGDASDRARSLAHHPLPNGQRDVLRFPRLAPSGIQAIAPGDRRTGSR
jgi:hypothetical protein